MSTTRRTPSPSSHATQPGIPVEVGQAPAGARFGNFVCTARLGAGAMGEVWRAWDTALNRWVALKFLKGGDEEELARFAREAQVAGKLSHPNIAAIYEVGGASDGKRPFIAMQFIDGKTLKDVQRRDRRALVRLIVEAARAVHFANEQGVVHRDLKPENLMVDRTGRVFVMDFGLARPVEGAGVSASGSIVGTPAYMPPEQARGERVDSRADVYSLGMALYDLLTDSVPFRGSNVYETLRMLQDEEPRRPRSLAPSIHADLETIVLKCLEKAPSLRYPTAGELADDLERYLEGEPISARPTGMLARFAKSVARRKALAAVVGVAIVALAVALVVLVPRLTKAEAKAEDAQRAAIARLRSTAQDCLAAALEMRRVGNLEKMREQAANLEAACKEATAPHPLSGEPHAYLGRLYRALMRPEDAMAQQEIALSKESGLASARYERAVLLALAVRKYARKLRETERGLRFADSEKREALVGDGWVAPAWRERIKSDPDAAKMLARLNEDLDAIETHPGPVTGAEILCVRGLRAWALGDLAQARELLTNAGSRLEEAMEALATIAVDEGRMDDAVAAYSHGIREDRGYLSYWDGRAHVHLMAGSRDLSRWQLAIDDYTEMLTMDPRHPDAHLQRSIVRSNLGLGRFQRGEDPSKLFEASLDDVAEQLRLAPGLMEAMLARGQACLNWGLCKANRGTDPVALYERALEAFTQAASSPACVRLATQSRGLVHRNWGVWLSRTGRDPGEEYRRSVEDFTEALRIAPGDGTALTRRAGTRVNWAHAKAVRTQDPTGLYEQAVADYEEALKSDSNRSGTWREMGTCLANWGAWRQERGGDFEALYRKALLAFGECLRRNEKDDEAWLSRGLARATWAAFRSRRGDRAWELFEQAMGDFGEALKLNEGRAETWMRRAHAKKTWGTLKTMYREDPVELYRAAIADCDEAVRRNETYVEAWELRGSTRMLWGNHLMSGPGDAVAQYREAVRDLDQAVTLGARRDGVWRERGIAHLHWGVCLAQRDKNPWEQFTIALGDFDRAIETNPDAPDSHWYRGNCRYNRGCFVDGEGKDASEEFRAALKDYARMLELNPSMKNQVANQVKNAQAYLRGK